MINIIKNSKTDNSKTDNKLFSRILFDKPLFIENLIKFIFIGSIGVLLHFLYDMINNDIENIGTILISIFSSINESIWEHMKIFFMSIVIMSVIEIIVKKIIKERLKHKGIYLYDINYYNRFVSTFISVALIPILYYSYTGIFGEKNDIVNIGIYYIATLVFCILEYRYFNRISNNINKNNININTKSYKEYIGIVMLVFIFLLFIVWTFEPPQIPLFQDPITLTYGK